MPEPRRYAPRPMLEADLDAVLAVQAACYPPSMQEAADVVLARLRAAPATTLVLPDAAGICAYAFAYPSRLGNITPLNAGFAPPPDPDTLYVHDLAVHPRAHGQGLGRRLARTLLDTGRGQGLRHGALVAVQGARPFWESLGFSLVSNLPGAGHGGEALASYPGEAVYLSRLLKG